MRVSHLLACLACAGLVASFTWAVEPNPTTQPALPAQFAQPAQPTQASQPAQATVAVADWVAADVLALIASIPQNPIPTPTTNLLPPTSPATTSPTSSPTKSTAKSISLAARIVRVDLGSQGLPLTASSRAALDAAGVFVATNARPDIADVALELTSNKPVWLDESIAPQLRVKRADKSIEPAYWQDAALLSRTILLARKALTTADPANADAYTAQSRLVRDRFVALNDDLLRIYSPIPRQSRVLIVGAQGLGNLARGYEFKLLIVPSEFTSKDGSKAMDDLASLVVSQQIPAVFPVDAAPNLGVAELVSRVQRKGGSIAIAPALYINTPLATVTNAPGAVEQTLRHNANTIAAALTPKASLMANPNTRLAAPASPK